jgi:hypothetical protein
MYLQQYVFIELCNSGNLHLWKYRFTALCMYKGLQLKIYVFKDLQHYAITALCIYNNLELQKWERSSQ